ncbi:MAG: fatty acid hydroxylase family protein [Bacteroidetes bacterium]|nr:MAG: fatty acid hydroxylase family protein [Bacteroidota bacterium]
MEQYWEIFVNGYKGYASYLWNDITHPSWHSYFYWLILVSVCFFVLEVVIPWRRNQPVPRKDFWLDAFYMFFNFFLFSLLIYNAASDVVVHLFNDAIKAVTGGFDLQALNPLRGFPMWAILLIGMLVRDFVQWWIHRLLHRVPWLWEFHKVHHSVEQMGFAAQLRYHWMENIVYRSLEYIPLALLGIGLYDFFVIHIFALTWGHYNHANISVSPRIPGAIVGALIGIVLSNSLLDITLFSGAGTPEKWGILLSSTAAGAFLLGPLMPYLFNSPEMHIWHHAYHLPKDRPYGVNFGLTLALWDYLFGTAYIPENGRDIPLGFPGVETFPKDFVGQNLHGIFKKE